MTGDILHRFPGVFSFEDTALSSQLFSGREEDGHKLMQYILAENLTILFATSGFGKTSILQAFVFGKLRENAFYPVIIRLNISDKSPQDIIKARFREIAKQPHYEYDEQPNNGELKNFFDAVEIWSEDIKLLTPVIVFDQFEEIFTLEHNSKYRESFFTELAGIINACREGKINIKIVISIREDMLGKLEKMAHLIPSIFTNRFLLKPLSRRSAGKAIMEPAGKELAVSNGTVVTPPFCFSEDAKEELLNFLCRKKEEGKWMQSDEVAPIQLQIICRELEEKAVEKAKLLTDADMAEIKCKDLQGEEKTVEGGLQRILGGFYDKQISKLKTELQLSDEEIQSIRNVIEVDLIAGNKRVPIEYSALITWTNIRKEGIDLLISNRLLKREEYGENSLIEISHDTLIEPILKSYEARKLSEEAAAHAEKANKLYERLLRKARDKFDLSDEELRALQQVIEEKLVDDHTRVSLSKGEILVQPHIRAEAVDMFIKEQLLKINADNEVEIYNDSYLDSIAKRQQIRYAEEREAELKLQNQKIEENKKRIRKNIWLAVITLLSVGAICSLMYFKTLSDKNKVIVQMAMLFKANEYLERGDLKKAFGIYGMLHQNATRTVSTQLQQLQLDYTDIPGNTVRVLANNHILSQLNDTTYQIWKIVSDDSISLDTTYTHIKLVAFSNDYTFFSIYANHKLILYNSNQQQDEERVLLDDSSGTPEPYFAFSKYGKYFSYFRNGNAYIISLESGSSQTLQFKWEDSYNTLFETLIYASGNNLFAYYKDNFYGWINNGKDSLEFDNGYSYEMHQTPWIYLNRDTIVYGIKKGIVFYSLQARKDSVAYKQDFSKAQYIESPAHDMIFLYSEKYFAKERRYKDYNLSFYNLKEHKLNTPFGNDTIEHLSVNADYTKCLIGDKDNNVYLTDNRAMNKTLLPFLHDAVAYDISDDGNTILFVKSSQDKSGKEVSSLYKHVFNSNTTQLIDVIYKNLTAKDSTSIYAKYFFRFSSDSRMYAYTQAKNDSTFFVVRNLATDTIVFRSPKIEKGIDDGYKKDFTSYYVHVQSKDGKEGVVLLNGKPRNVDYFSRLYPAMSKEEWDKEVKSLNLNL